jgi:hypothetical protein
MRAATETRGGAPYQGARGLCWLWLSCALACAGRPLPYSSGAATASPNPEEVAWDAGLLSPTPGVVRCGSIACARGYECCLRIEGSPAAIGCGRRSEYDCPEGPTRWCDETADCNPGELCCMGPWSNRPALYGYCNNSMIPGAAVTSCDVNEYIACANDDDCRAVGALPCVAQRCRGDVLQTCGPIPTKWCPP